MERAEFDERVRALLREHEALTVRPNVKADGNVVVNRRTLSEADLTTMLKGLVTLNPDQAVVIRGDEAGAYKNIVSVLNACSLAGVTNVAFATAK